MTMHRQAYSARSGKAPERRQGARACSAAVPHRDGMLYSSAASLSLLAANVQGRSRALEPARRHFRDYHLVRLGFAPEPLEWQRRAAPARNQKAARRPPNHNARALAVDLAVSRESYAALLQSMPSRSSTAAQHAIALCLRSSGFLDLAEYAWRCMVM